GPSHPGPLLKRPARDKCSERGKPSHLTPGPKNQGRSDRLAEFKQLRQVIHIPARALVPSVTDPESVLVVVRVRLPELKSNRPPPRQLLHEEVFFRARAHPPIPDQRTSTRAVREPMIPEHAV